MVQYTSIHYGIIFIETHRNMSMMNSVLSSEEAYKKRDQSSLSLTKFPIKRENNNQTAYAPFLKMITDAPNKAAWKFPTKQKAEKKLAQEVLTGLLTEASAWLSKFVKEKDLVFGKV